MTTPIEVKAGGQQPNPQKKEGEPNPQPQPKPEDGKVTVDQLTTKVDELSTKLETVTRQYSGSSEEALRLKQERDDLAEQVKQLTTKADSRSANVDDATFQQTLETDGTHAAVESVVDSKLKVLMDKVDSLLNDRAADLLGEFKNQHPGLAGELYGKFNTKLTQLKPIYSDVAEAMNDAYRLVGGVEADQTAIEAAKATEQQKEDKEQSEEEKAAAIKVVSQSSSGDAVPLQPDEVSALKKQIGDLEHTANVLSIQGQEDLRLRAKLEVLKQKLAEQA